LAISDLVVGVSNDATNFLNSAIGSKAAPRYVIMTIATVGILLGSVFSSGMMEVARSGVFYPQMFTFADIMMVFLAVMFTDVILLDLFNTFGLPTSTTVSLVFELLGSAVAVAFVKISSSVDGSAHLAQYINSSKAMGIISGILVSVVVAFVCGSIIMYITRMIFSFSYKKSFRYLGSVWCGLALTAISYFVIFKGLKGTTLISVDQMDVLNQNVGLLVLSMIGVWTMLMVFVQFVLKVNILKVTVLAGTFSLALAFAGNDLVNFIGVFMAGFDSYNIAAQTGDMGMMMGDLTKPVVANTPILLFAGVVMGLTLWFSKKAQTVTDTEVNLARQDTGGTERFNSTQASRGLVRMAVNINKGFEHVVPNKVLSFINGRFQQDENNDKDDAASFDLIRATVNLTVASLLISMATSLKLPLSTTYVTFMVAMGSSLSDKAWGRESAVYRVTGVLTVISGWFLTAFIAFTVAFVVALALMYGQAYAVYGLAILCAYMLIQSNVSHKRRVKKEQENSAHDYANEDIILTCEQEVCETMKKVISVYDGTLSGIFTEDRRLLRQMVKESEELYQTAHERKYAIHPILAKLTNNYISNGHYYVQVVDYMNEVTKALVHITRPSFEHIDNNHTGFTAEQIADLKEIEDKVTVIYGMINHMLLTGDYTKIDQTLHLRDTLFEEFAQVIKRQISRIKTGDTSTRASMLYLDIISETKTMILQSRNLLKAQKHFVSK
ncbi:MAG: inorganic phosphate transporter, partial [Rikenellaceae bacterium]